MKYRVDVTLDGITWTIEVPELELHAETEYLGMVEHLAKELIAQRLDSDSDEFSIDVRYPPVETSSWTDPDGTRYHRIMMTAWSAGSSSDTPKGKVRWMALPKGSSS